MRDEFGTQNEHSDPFELSDSNVHKSDSRESKGIVIALIIILLVVLSLLTTIFML